MTMQPSFSEADIPAAPRADVDIAEDIAGVIRAYPPLQASRPFTSVTVDNGQVAVSGNVRSALARRYLLDRIPRLAGVTGVNAEKLHDDDMLLIAIGELIPDGIYAAALYGAIALTGMLPRDKSAQALVDAVKAVPGVRHVTANFDNAPLNADR